jgi:hypothetical protein
VLAGDGAFGDTRQRRAQRRAHGLRIGRRPAASSA